MPLTGPWTVDRSEPFTEHSKSLRVPLHRLFLWLDAVDNARLIRGKQAIPSRTGTSKPMADVEREIAEAQAARKLALSQSAQKGDQREHEKAAFDQDIYGGGQGRFAGYDRRWVYLLSASCGTKADRRAASASVASRMAWTRTNRSGCSNLVSFATLCARRRSDPGHAQSPPPSTSSRSLPRTPRRPRTRSPPPNGRRRLRLVSPTTTTAASTAMRRGKPTTHSPRANPGRRALTARI